MKSCLVLNAKRGLQAGLRSRKERNKSKRGEEGRDEKKENRKRKKNAVLK